MKITLPNIRTVIGITSAKGGTGKTFVASNLALSLAENGKRVGIMDANISSPDLYRVFGITGKIQPDSESKIVPLEKYGVKCVSMAGLIGSPDEAIVWRGPILSKIIQQLLKETLWGELDFLLIDFPPCTSDTFLTILQGFHIHGALVITTPQELSQIAAARTINALTLTEVRTLGIIENMRGESFGEGGGMRLSEMFRVPFLGSIPARRQISTLSDAGQPPYFSMEELKMIFSKISRAILEKAVVE